MYVMPGEPIHVYFRGADDLNAIEGDSLAWVHPSCPGVVEAIDIAELSVGERLHGMMFSLHGGYTFGPVLGSVLVIVTGVSLVFFAVSGIVVFFTRTWRPGRRRRSGSLEEAVPAE